MSNNISEGSGWTGWVYFAGLMLIVAGFFHIIAGIVALFKDSVYVNAASGSVWVLNYTTWGWVHILGGLLAWWAGASLMSGRTWARVFAVIVAILSAIANMAFVPIYPFWSIMIIVVDFLVIFAVAVHGGELKDLNE